MPIANVCQCCRSISQVGKVVVACLALLASSQTTLAAGHKQFPMSIVVEKADITPGAMLFACQTRFFDISRNSGRVPCYGPDTIRQAYGLSGLGGGALLGAGQTIVILDAFGSPTAAQDLAVFDSQFGIPAPPSFTVVTMPGTPAFNPNDGNMVGWAEEVSLDVQWSHAIAPAAKIVLVAAVSNNDDDLIAGLNYAIDAELGSVVSMSFGESEASLTDPAGQLVVAAWEQAFKRAGERHMTLFVSSGDQGSTNTADAAGDVFPFQNVSYPASSSRVTGVGGTNLFFGTRNAAGIPDRADPNGSYLGETVWNDEPQGIAAAGGGGVSVLFSEPDYQRSTLAKATDESLHKHRGVPDVAYNAGVVGGVLVHLGFAGFNAFFVFGGTSAGAPQWAGITAIANQLGGRPLGFLNTKLYRLGRSGLLSVVMHDVTVGDNGFCFFTVPNGAFACVPGFSATPSWDLATGWGTPNRGLVLLLVATGDGEDDDGGFDF